MNLRNPDNMKTARIRNSILLAAGHGGRDTGAVSTAGHMERDQAIIMVDMMAERLSSEGVSVIIAPHNLDTHETIPWMNERYQWGDVWALEIHRDSALQIAEPAASMRCGIYHGNSDISRSAAALWLGAMKARGAHSTSWMRSHTESRHGRLGWIAQPKALSHIIELGFMQGRNDRAHLEMLAIGCAESLAFTLRSLRATAGESQS